jgi:hypothetical protein
LRPVGYNGTSWDNLTFYCDVIRQFADRIQTGKGRQGTNA